MRPLGTSAAAFLKYSLLYMWCAHSAVCDQVRFLKRAKEGSQREEEWMCLAKRRFLWNVDSWSSTQPNPTFSARYTPQAEDAVDKKVRAGARQLRT